MNFSFLFVSLISCVLASTRAHQFSRWEPVFKSGHPPKNLLQSFSLLKPRPKVRDFFLQEVGELSSFGSEERNIITKNGRGMLKRSTSRESCENSDACEHCLTEMRSSSMFQRCVDHCSNPDRIPRDQPNTYDLCSHMFQLAHS